MAKRKVVLSALFLLTSGMALGAILSPILIRHGMFHIPPPRHHMSPAQAVIDHLERELHLTGEQRRKILPIVEQAQAKLDELRLQSVPQFESIIEDGSKQAAEFLTVEQREKLYDMEILAKQHFRRAPDAGPPPPEADFPGPKEP